MYGSNVGVKATWMSNRRWSKEAFEEVEDEEYTSREKAEYDTWKKKIVASARALTFEVGRFSAR
jgi:hypothetical protein